MGESEEAAEFLDGWVRGIRFSGSGRLRPAIAGGRGAEGPRAVRVEV